MAVKAIKTLELHYPVIQFSIIRNKRQWLGYKENKQFFMPDKTGARMFF